MKNLETAPLPSGLYLVATPIGNLRDITLRALDALAAADMIVCEDTRVTGKLLAAYDIDSRMLSYNDHNAAKARGPVLEALSGGGRVVLVSDAGMPLISDPGYKLVRDALDLGLPVTSLPGANAPLTALQLSGLPSDAFAFLGFLPPKAVARQKRLKVWRDLPGTLILFETGPRLCESLADMLAVWGDRPAAVLRELTKMYEEGRRDTLARLLDHYREHGAPKGEIVVVVGTAAAQALSDEELQGRLRTALQTMSVRDAAAAVAAETGAAKKALYDMALALKENGTDGAGG